MPLFKSMLRRMGHPDVRLIEQATDGTLLPGPEGECLIESRDIYSVFVSPEELRVIVQGGREIGQIPAQNPIVPGQLLILAGRRWRVAEVDAKRREVLVTPAGGGVPPSFEGGGRSLAAGVVQEMRRVYEDLETPRFLDATAIQLLAEARTSFDRLGLRHSGVIREAGRILIFPWTGGPQLNALRLALTRAGLTVEASVISLGVPSEEEQTLADCLGRLASSDAPDGPELARLASVLALEKYDAYLGEDLLAMAYASEHLDVRELPALARNLAGFLRRADA